ncbi:MAG: anaerobic ribonucleoside-triphosphate reductase [Candidatus Hydrothermarchaeota archaeon]
MRIVKASGDVEPFDPNVVTQGCVEAGIDFWTAAEVALEVSKRTYDGMTTRDIETTTLGILYKKSPEAAERYKRYRSMLVRTSQNTIEPFERKRIVASLVKETGLPRELAEVAAKESEEELRRLKIDFVSAPLIREIVNVKLLEHGFEEARANYTRLGMPIYDAHRTIEGLEGHRDPEGIYRQMAGSILREYALLKALPLHLADAHMRGEIYIHDLEYFPTRPSSLYHDLRFFLQKGLLGPSAEGPAERAEVAILHAVGSLRIAQKNLSGTQSMDFLNVFLAPYLRGLDNDRLEELAKLFFFEAGRAASGPWDLGLEYGVPQPLAGVPAVGPGGRLGGTYGDFEEEARLFARALVDVWTPGSPRLNLKLRKEDLRKEGYGEFMERAHGSGALFLNLSHERAGGEVRCGGLFIEEGIWRAGGLQTVTINLPRVAYEAGGDDGKLFQALKERLSLAREVAMVKREIMTRRLDDGLLPFLAQKLDGGIYYPMETASNLVGYLGLNEMLKAHLGQGLHETKSALRMGEKVLTYIHDTLGEWARETGLPWALIQCTDGSVAGRLARLDSGQYSDRAVVNGDIGTGVYYTPASWVREEADLPIMERLALEGVFHSLAAGGAWAQVRAEEGMTPGELWELSRRIASETRVASWYYIR